MRTILGGLHFVLFQTQIRNPRFLSNLVIGDEANFGLNGQINSQNVRRYALRGNHPEFTYEVSERREKCTVWIGLCGNGTLIGPLFFARNMNGLTYIDIHRCTR